MATLNEIGLKHGTDKSSMTHHYLDRYESMLGHLRDKEITILELGVAAGSSLKTWAEFFPKAKVHGIDVNPDCKEYVPNVHIGSQTDAVFLDNLISDIGIPDVIIDDGSHVGDDMVFTFRHLFPKMKSGGIYCIEDCATLYIPTYSGEFEANGRSKGYNFFADLIYHIDVAGRGCNGNAQFCIDHPTDNPPVPEFSRVLESMTITCSLYKFVRR